MNDFSESPMPAFPGQGLPVGLVHNNGLAIFIIGLGSLLWYCFQPSEAGPTASTQLVQFGLGPSFALIFLSLNTTNMFYKQLVKYWTSLIKFQISILLLTTIAYSDDLQKILPMSVRTRKIACFARREKKIRYCHFAGSYRCPILVLS